MATGNSTNPPDKLFFPLLSHRELYAALALQGLLAAGEKTFGKAASEAVLAADALIEALRK